jgi:hypothetical protein
MLKIIYNDVMLCTLVEFHEQAGRMSNFHWNTWYHILQDSTPHSHCWETLKSNVHTVFVNFVDGLHIGIAVTTTVTLCYYYIHLSLLKLALDSLTGGDRSIGIVRLRTKTTEYLSLLSVHISTLVVVTVILLLLLLLLLLMLYYYNHQPPLPPPLLLPLLKS